MQTYGEFRPTEFDPAGLALPDRADWLVMRSTRTRDSTPFENSNFETTLDILGGEGEDVEAHHFSHWGPGWFEIVLVRPGTEAALRAEEIETRLDDYALLDEDDASRQEYESYLESWESWGAGDFARALAAEHGLDEDSADLLLDADKERLREFFQSLVPGGDYMEDSSPVVRRAMGRPGTAEKLDAFLDAEQAFVEGATTDAAP